MLAEVLCAVVTEWDCGWLLPALLGEIEEVMKNKVQDEIKAILMESFEARRVRAVQRRNARARHERTHAEVKLLQDEIQLATGWGPDTKQGNDLLIALVERRMAIEQAAAEATELLRNEF